MLQIKLQILLFEGGSWILSFNIFALFQTQKGDAQVFVNLWKKLF